MIGLNEVAQIGGGGFAGLFIGYLIAVRDIKSIKKCLNGKQDVKHCTEMRDMCNNRIDTRLKSIEGDIKRYDSHFNALDSKLSEHRAILSTLLERTGADER